MANGGHLEMYLYIIGLFWISVIMEQFGSKVCKNRFSGKPEDNSILILFELMVGDNICQTVLVFPY